MKILSLEYASFRVKGVENVFAGSNPKEILEILTVKRLLIPSRLLFTLLNSITVWSTARQEPYIRNIGTFILLPSQCKKVQMINYHFLAKPNLNICYTFEEWKCQQINLNHLKREERECAGSSQQEFIQNRLRQL